MSDVIDAVLTGPRINPAGPALTDPSGRTISHAQFGARIRSVATGLRAQGLRPGDRMLFSIRPSRSGIALALGCVAAGGTIVFADPGVGRELFASRMQLAAPAWAAAESVLYAVGRPGPGQALARRRGLLLPDLAGLAVRHIHSGPWVPGVPRSAVSLRRLLASPATELPAAHSDQEAVVVFTSGTTGAPKAAVHTRKSLGAALELAARAMRITSSDEVFTDQFLLGLPTLAAGGHWRLPPFGLAPRADAARLAALIGSASIVFAVPADLAVIGRAVADGEVPLPPRLRCVVTAGAPVTPVLVGIAESLVPATDLIALYGMTEILPVTATTGAAIVAHTGSGDLIGSPLPGVRAVIAQDGELSVSGPNLIRGYLGAEPMIEHPTGDLARFDAGRLVLMGRKKDMLIRGSTNIYPSLYEPAIAALPGVGEAAVIGVPDPLGDEAVVLMVTPDDRSRAVPAPGGRTPAPLVMAGHRLADQLAAQLPVTIDAAAVPDRIVVIDAMPASGRSRKIDRNVLRALATEVMSAGQAVQ